MIQEVNMLKGIDISAHQKGIDLSKLDVDFVIVKVSEGYNWYDPMYAQYTKSILSLGKLLGMYHFARPTEENDPKIEAQYFIKIFRDYIGKAIPILDWEAENQHNTAWAKAWLDEVYEKTGVRAWIYMSESVVNSYDWSHIANHHALWVAKYRDYQIDVNYDTTNLGTFPSIKYWKNYTAWQWTSSGRLSGYYNNLDCNFFYGTEDDWKTFCSTMKHVSDSNSSSHIKLKYTIGIPVCTNRIWSSSTDTGCGFSGDWQGLITSVNEGAPHPYLIGDGIGWTDDASIDADPHIPQRTTQKNPSDEQHEKYQIGTSVCTSILATSSQGSTVYQGDWSGVITKVIPGAAYPYLLNNGTGWTNDQGIENDPHIP